MCAAAGLPRAGSVTVFGPDRFTRRTGAPTTERRQFSVRDTSRLYRLTVENHGVDSAVVRLNGAVVLRPDDFEGDKDDGDREKAKDKDRKEKGRNRDEDRDGDGGDKDRPRLIERRVSLRLSNELTVEVRGEPGRYFVLWVSCEDCDATPPTIRASASPPPNASGWNNANVTLTFTCADAESGIASCTPPILVNQDGANQTIAGTAIDRAGNTATTSLTVNLDKAAPTISANLPPSNGGWYNQPVTISYSCSDDLSGIATCAPPVIVSANGPNTVTGTAIDRAGNSASTSVTASLDVIPPSIAAVVTPPANAAGWRAGDVTIAFGCSDVGSGVATCPAPIVVTTDGANQTFTGTATDRAGNAASTAVTVNVDKSAPTITAHVDPAANAFGWNHSDVTVSFTCNDTGSGISTCPSPIVVTTEGPNQPVIGTAIDKAGNIARATAMVSIDKTPEAVTASVAPAPNPAGWNNTDAIVSFVCTDSVSGAAGCPDPVLVSTEGAGQSISRPATDRAGNTSTATAVLNIDKTPPHIEITAPSDGATVSIAAATLTGTIADSLSGVASATCNGVAALVVNGAVTCGVSLSQGQNTLVVAATDVAGNATSRSVVVTFAPDHRPTASVAAVSSSTTVGQPAQFDASQSSDADGDPLTFSWDFGDGSTGSGASVSHVYQSAGAFDVVLTVDDGRGGIDSASLHLTVASAPHGLGRGVITGRVFNDDDGLPIADAIVDVVSVDGNGSTVAPSRTTTDALGRFRLSSPTGRARLHVSKEGFTSTDRFIDVADAQRIDPVDARLTALDPKTVTVTSVLGNVVSNTAGDLRLAIPAGALSSDASLRLTRVGGAGSVLPLGWSPIAAFDLAPAGISWTTPANLVLPAPPGLPAGATPVLAQWDVQTGAWTAAGFASRSSDGGSFQTTLAHTGQYVLALPDPSPNAPPFPGAGQALAGVDFVAAQDAHVTITPSPKILFDNASAHSKVGVLVTPSSPAPSGSLLRLDVAESYALTDATSLFLARAPRQLPLYRYTSSDAPAGSLTLQSQSVATPSRLFSPFRLQRGTIDLAARLPGRASPYGVLIAPSGGQVADARGDRLVVPSGASQDDLPVALAPLDPADIPMPLPSGLTLVAAADVDFHGASLSIPAALSVPAPLDLDSSATVLVVRLTEAEAITQLELVAVGRAQGGSLAASVDPFGDGSLLFPGIRREGSYLFLKPSQPVGFVTGVATGADGSPLSGALVSGGTLGLVAIAASDGRYSLASAPGDATFTARNAITSDPVTFTAHLQSGAVVAQSSSSGVTFLSIVSTTPSNGASAIPLTSSVRATFSNAIDPASIAGSLTVASDAGAVAGIVALTPDGRGLVFRPGTLLASNSAYQVTVGGSLRSIGGRPLAAPATAHFTTINTAPPAAPPPGAVTATIPGADNMSNVSGSAGTADPAGVVVVKNLATGVVTTLTPNADGSFSGRVAASTRDRLQLTVRDAAGNSTTVPIDPFRNPDGGVAVTADGGRVEGPAGTFVDVPAGALPAGTIVKVEPVAEAALPAPAPSEYPFTGALRLDLGGATASAPLHIGVAAPPDATVDEQVLVGSPLVLKDRTTWTLVDRAHLANGRYTTESPPFPSVLGGGVFGFFRPATGSCISYVNLIVDFGEALLIEGIGDPFAFVADVQSLVLAKRCESPINIRVSNPDTAAVIRQIDARTPATNGQIDSVAETLTDDHTPPLVTEFDTFNGQHVDHLEVHFSETMDAASLARAHFHVEDSHGAPIGGTVDITASNTVVTFRPDLPFRFGEQYTVTLVDMKDRAGNALVTHPTTFTPFDPTTTDPFPLARFGAVPGLGDALQKCVNGSCNTSVRDNVSIGNAQFLANGLANGSERYQLFPPERLIALDVSKVTAPRTIGFSGLPSNPRALAAVEKVVRVTQPGGRPFAGNLLLVASGGRILDDVELASRLDLYDVSRCTTDSVLANCLADALSPLKGFKYLSTPTGEAPMRGAPLESGVPQQIAVLHQAGGAVNTDGTIADDTIAAYVTVSGVGLEAVDVTHAFNAEQLADPSVSSSVPLGPDGLLRGDFLDVAVVKNQVAAIEQDPTSGAFSLDLFSAQLTDKRTISLSGPAARVAILEDLLVDVDGDGRVGSAEDNDGNDGITSRDELFDLALVSSGPLSTCPTGAPNPCGEVVVIDLSTRTDLRHSADRDRGIVARIPLPGPAFSIRVDPAGAVAYVEVRGKGLAIIDLSSLVHAIQSGAAATSLLDANRDGLDDRVLDVVDKGDIFNGRVNVDVSRGVAFVNGNVTGLAAIEVANRCSDLSAGFGSDAPDNTSRVAQTGQVDLAGALRKEKAALLDLLQRAAQNLGTDIAKPAMLEQGSGACFWRGSDSDLAKNCTAFTPGVSDHDIEVMVPQGQVEDAQRLLDAFMVEETKHHTSDVFKTVSLFAFSRDSYEALELLNGTPQNKTGDATGDLAMGRQLLLLLWTLEGEFVDGFPLLQPAGCHSSDGCPLKIDEVFQKLKTRSPIVPGPDELSFIPRLEGYEWSLLQEMNFYKTGALLRIVGGCGTTSGLIDATVPPDPDEVSDRDRNFDEPTFLSKDCQDQLHGVAKAGIRTVMARLAGDTRTNAHILDLSDLNTYRTNGCLTGTDTPRDPPSSWVGYSKKGCGSFEEYAASVAIQSVKDNRGVFHDGDLPLIYRMFCIKVGEHCADGKVGGPLITADRDANQFVHDVLAFIQDAQRATRDVYDGPVNGTVSLDTKPIGQIPFLDDIRDKACHKAGVDGVADDSPRSLLRKCNKEIVKHKLEGGAPLSTPALDGVEIVNKDRTKELQEHFGARKLVLKDLRVRLSNASSSNLPDGLVRLYVGDGVQTDNYKTLKEVSVKDLAPDGSRVVEVDPGDPDQKRPAFALAFVLPNLGENRTEALAFFLDPDRRAPEAIKKDNQAAFFFYVLNPSDPSSAPTSTAPPVSAIRDTTADPLCRPRSTFNITLQLRDLNNPSDVATNDLRVSVGHDVEFQYHVENPGRESLTQLTIERTGGAGPVFSPVDLPPTSPTSRGFNRADPVPFHANTDGPYYFTAIATAKDARGNIVRAESTTARLAVTPATCPVAIVALAPDPNPFDKTTGLPASEIMKGGSLYRHYRVLDGLTNQPKANASIKVTSRLLPNGAAADLMRVASDADGYLVHDPIDADDNPPRGLMIDVDTLGQPDQIFEIKLVPDGTSVNDACGQAFTVNIKERTFTRSLGTGADLKLAAKKVYGPLGIEGNEGIGFTMSQSATDAGPQNLTFSRSTSTATQLQAGGDPRDALKKFLEVEIFTQDGKVEDVEAGGNSAGSASAGASLSVLLMAQDAHQFAAPLDVNSCLQTSLLAEGGLMTAAFGATPIPGMKLFGIALIEAAEQMTRLAGSNSLASRLASAGGSIGGTFSANANGKSGKLTVRGTGTPLDGTSVVFSFNGSVTATLSGRLSYAPQANELTSTFTLKAAAEGAAGFTTDFGDGLTQALAEIGDAEDVNGSEFRKLVKKTLKGRLLEGEGNATQTFSIVWDTSQGITSASMKRIVLSLEGDKTWGITEQMLEGQNVDANPGVTKKSVYTISNPLKFADAIQTFLVIQALQGSLPLQVLFGFDRAGKEMTKLLALADSYEIQVEHGRGGKFNLNPGKLIKTDKFDLGLEFKYDESVTHKGEVGSIRRGERFRIATYPDDYPSPDEAVLFSTLSQCLGAEEQAVESAYRLVTKAIAKGASAVKTLVSLPHAAPPTTLPPANGPGGPSDDGVVEQTGDSGADVELLVDGAAEPNPSELFEIDLIGFPFRAREASTTPRIPSPLDVGGPAGAPHYGIGGFFQFAPDRRPLAAPAPLTIHYTDADVAGFDESQLGIYRWNDARADWEFLGGTVDATNRAVTIAVTRLGMYTLGLPMPAGAIGLTAHASSNSALQGPTTTVTFTSDVIRMNTGGVVPDGTLFSIQVANPSTSGLVPFGTVTSPDEDAATDWTQVSSHGGVVQFTADLPGSTGQARVVVISVVGTALANKVLAYP